MAKFTHVFAGNRTYPPGTYELPPMDLAESASEVGFSGDIANAGVTLALTAELSTDGGNTWDSIGGMTSKGGVPDNWPGKDQGFPPPTMWELVVSVDNTVWVNPKIRGTLSVVGGNYRSAINIIGSNTTASSLGESHR